jgi:hypothetical protein
MMLTYIRIHLLACSKGCGDRNVEKEFEPGYENKPEWNQGLRPDP